MRKIICDRCGADISKESEYGFIWMGTRDYNEEVSMDEFMESEWSGMDFCEDCMAKIEEFILSQPATPTEAPKEEPKATEPEAEPEEEAEPAAPEKAKTVKPKELDTGKIIALYKAGWSYKAIADELRSNVSAIGRVIRLAKEEGTI